MVDANKKYLKQFLLGMGSYMVVLGGSVYYLNNNELPPLETGLLAMSPVLPMLYVLYAIVERFRSMDEYYRRIIGESIIWAAGIVGSVSFAYGFLAGSVDVPDISLIWVLPAIIGTYGVVSALMFWSNK